MTQLQAAILAAAICAVAGFVMPLLVARIPEPEPKAEADMSAAEIAEGPKETYVAVAALPWFALTSLAVSGVAGGLVGWVVGGSWLLVGLAPLVPVGVVLAVVDLRTRLLPRVVVVPTTLVLVALGTIGSATVFESSDLVRGLVGLAVGRSFYWVLWFVRSAGMGFGDVRLAALLGFALAYVGWPEFAVGMYAGFLVFGLPGALLALVRWDARLMRAHYPYGPFMLAGALIGLCVGDPVVDYLVSRQS